MVIHAWEETDDTGQPIDWRVIETRSVWPVRIEGKWYMGGTDYYALQQQERYDNPPSFFVTLDRSFTLDRLLPQRMASSHR
jgi:hypothetical protein